MRSRSVICPCMDTDFTTVPIHAASYGNPAKQTHAPSCLLSTSELKAKLHFLVQFEHAKEFNVESVEKSE